MLLMAILEKPVAPLLHGLFVELDFYKLTDAVSQRHPFKQ